MAAMERPVKRAKFLDYSSEESDTGVQLHGDTHGFTINEAYAKRFEHNQKREEKQRLEEKYGVSSNGKRERDVDEDDIHDSSTDESEDDDAELVTEDVDKEWLATLQAIKDKDPRVYDAEVKFYKDFDVEAAMKGPKKEKPMYLQDYHRQNLLAGRGAVQEIDDDTPNIQSYQDAENELKRAVVGSMHAAAEDRPEDGEDEFMVAKSRTNYEDLPATRTKKAKKITEEDIEAADKDPETFLSNFMAARAWLPTDGSRFQAFDSDDSEDEKRADEFEEAYNMRFEDPKTANEKLQSFARDVGKYGVRRDEKSGRAKAREREQERKEAEKRERDEGRARLRKLKIEEAEEKVKRIKEAAGLRGQELDLEEWRDVIEGDFSDEKWEQEMQRRFGDAYYADQDDYPSEGDDEAGQKKRKPRKPAWDDDIDINDLVPDFENEENAEFSLSDEEDDGASLPPAGNGKDDHQKKKRKAKKDRENERSDAKRAARKDRRKIEEMVDAALPFHNSTLPPSTNSKAPIIGFRYRETSPTSFGMSARDILFADDAQLNQFAGLKKLHTFRDNERKERDRRKLSKKQRLQKWRKETFGKSSAPQGGFERVLGSAPMDDNIDTGVLEAKEGTKKRKRKTNKNKNVKEVDS